MELTEKEGIEWNKVKDSENIHKDEEFTIVKSQFSNYPKAARHYIHLFPNHYLDPVELEEKSLLKNQVNEFNNFNILSPNEFSEKYTGHVFHAEKIIISMGRLQKVKGFDILIDSFSKILEHYPKVKLLIAGQDEGEYEKAEEYYKKIIFGRLSFYIVF